jgi:Sap, sulfolipid-1-addressing protein
MTAHFFALAFAAAVNPSLLAVDLVLVVNQRPSTMLLCVLAGGMGTAVIIGLVDVLIIRSNVEKSQAGLGPGASLALGLPLLAVGALLATGHLRSRKPAKQAGADPTAKDKPSWTERALSQPRLGLAVAVGAVLGLPGAIYLAAMHGLVTGTSSTPTKVAAVVIFATIEFALIIIPIILLAVRPAHVHALLERAQGWLQRHGRKALGYAMLVLGAYLTISGIVALLLMPEFQRVSTRYRYSQYPGLVPPAWRDRGGMVRMESPRIHQRARFGCGIDGRTP